MSFFQIVRLAITVIRVLSSLSSGERAKAGKQIENNCRKARERDQKTWKDEAFHED